MFKPILTVNRVSRVKDVQAALRALDTLAVYVGVPAAESSRRQVAHEKTKAGKVQAKVLPALDTTINNAELLYIHTHGSPLRHIPARPVIEPAIEDDKVNIVQELKGAAQAALVGDRAGAVSGLQRAGQEGENAARGWFTNPKNNWAPNAPATIAAKGSDRPLIDTAQLRKAIIWVLGKEG